MSMYAHYIPSSVGEEERKRKHMIDEMLREIEGAQATVANNLGMWIRCREHSQGEKQAKQAWDRMNEARKSENTLFAELFHFLGVQSEQQKMITRR
jgi:hypothetical protein